MKLKPIVASLMLLGLTAPAFADAPAYSAGNNSSQIDAMQAQLNQMQAIINQNSAGGFQSQCPDWVNRITVSGMLNVDAYFSNRTPNFGADPAGSDDTIFPAGDELSHGHTNNIDVNNANLFVDADVNCWTKVHFNILNTSNASLAITPWLRNVNATFDEAYVTIGDFAVEPFYFRAGREYVPFGVYNRYPMVENPTQMLSETRAVAAQAGFVTPIGVYGSAYTFRGDPRFEDLNTDPFAPVQNDRPRIQNYGADLGFAYCNPCADWDTKLDAGWIRNMTDVNYISNGLPEALEFADEDTFAGHSFDDDRVNGLALSADFGVAQFDAELRYVKALQAFDVPTIASFDLDGSDPVDGAKPAAWGAEVGYTFAVFCHSSRVDIGYQGTKDSSSNVFVFAPGVSVNSVGGFGMPKSRYYVGYSVNVSKWTDVSFEVYRDRDYSEDDQGTGRRATTGAVQLGVKFA